MVNFKTFPILLLRVLHRDAWMVQLVNHLTLDLAQCSVGSLLKILSLFLFLPPSHLYTHSFSFPLPEKENLQQTPYGAQSPIRDLIPQPEIMT